MSTKTKIWLIIAASLVLIGGMLFVGVMTMLNWDFMKLSTDKFETNNYVVSEDYKNISVVIDTADINFVPAADSKTSVVCYEQKKMKHSVEVEDGTLVIKKVDTRKWYEYIGVSFDSPKITVYIPQGECGSLTVKSSTGKVEIPKELSFEDIDITETTGAVNCYASASGRIRIKTSTGNIAVENISAGDMDLCVTTGRITVNNVNCGNVKINVSTGKTLLTDIACKNLTSGGSTGDIHLKNVVASDKFVVNRSTGDVKFERCDAGEIFVQTDTGDVMGTLLSEKVFITETDTGYTRVPKSVSGGRCEITTDTGNIKIDVLS